MMQNLKTCRTGAVTVANTAAHQLPDVPARLIVLEAPAGNTSDVTVLGLQPDGTPDVAGLTLVKGGAPLTLWADNLNAFAYQLGTSGDSVVYLVVR